MGFTRAPKDAKQLVRTYRQLTQQLACVLQQAGDRENQVRTAAENLRQEQVIQILRDTPVEELNRGKRGFRIKTLRECGYETVADVYLAPVSRVAAINGISDEGAAEICRTAENLASQAEAGSRIRLSSDCRTPGATELVLALSRMQRSQELLQEAQELEQIRQHETEWFVDQLRPASNVFRWFFTGTEKQQKALEACDRLRSYLDGSFGVRTRDVLERGARIDRCTGDEAWADFESSPILLIQLLEKTCPGMLGAEDTVYGLPEDLAEQIQQEPFYPEGLRCQLRRYQEWGTRYILHQQRVLLGDEMGLGKTVQAIAAMVSLRNTGGTHFMIVCPASVVENWCREISRHSDLQVWKIHGAGWNDTLAEWMEQGGAAVTTYETTVSFRLGPEFRFCMLTVDEAHYVKNPQARRTISVRELCSHAQRVLFMTGTALENRVDEMIELITMLQPGIGAEVRGLISLSAAPEFREKVAPVYYRRKREDVLTELPELIEKMEWCMLGPLEQQAYEAAVLSRQYPKSRQVSWSVDDLSQSCKASRMMELIEDAREENRKVIVFSFFLDTIRKVTQLVGERCLEPITGKVSAAHRQEIVDAFDEAPAGTVLAAQIQSGGTGLNIQAASVVILCEPQLKPSIENQAISRAYRMGQTRTVLVYRLLCEDTVDERITELLAQKQTEFDAFADESVAARESAELDQKALGSILDAEIRRIETKNAEKLPEIEEKGVNPDETQQ